MIQERLFVGKVGGHHGNIIPIEGNPEYRKRQNNMRLSRRHACRISTPDYWDEREEEILENSCEAPPGYIESQAMLSLRNGCLKLFYLFIAFAGYIAILIAGIAQRN